MRKIINNPDDAVKEMMEGFTGAYDNYYVKHPEVNGVILRQKRRDKVALVIGGGSGHEPMFAGFVGKGLADAAACGNFFASPDPNTIYQTAKAVDSHKGILFVYGCYAGDNLNFDMGEELLRADHIDTAHVRVRDDVASAPKERIKDRRGIAGDLFVVKTAGAACDAGLDLAEVKRVTEKARDNTWSVGVATAPAQLPGAEHPIFELGEGEMEYGMGIHGERGVRRTGWMRADELSERIYRQIVEESGLRSGDEVCVLVNSLGSTSVAELAIVYRSIKRLLEKDHILIHDADLNAYCTSQEMGGFSVTLFRLDDELKKYYDMPCYSPYYARGGQQPRSDKNGSSGKEIEECGQSNSEEAAAALKRHELKRSRTGALDVLGVQDAKAMLDYVADKIIAEKPFLTEIDSAVGDGDHGIGMAVGMKKVKEALRQMGDTENVYDVFDAAGKAMLMSMGGASGVIFGSLYSGGTAGEAAKSELTAEDMARMERRSLQVIQERGHAKPGDKTMVDALAPAVEAMEAYCRGGLAYMLREAEEAARRGMEATKLYQAGFGRAKSLMERAVGYQDAGATSVWLILQGMREFAEN